MKLYQKGMIALFVFLGIIAQANAAFLTEEMMQIQIFQAAGTGDQYTLRRLLSEGYDINAKDAYGNTALCRAMLQGYHKTYDTLLAYGADPKPACMRKIPFKVQDNFMRDHYQPVFSSQNNMGMYTTADATRTRAVAPVGGASVSGSTLLWGTLGLAAVGGGVALAVGGGGGGGGNHAAPPTPAVDECPSGTPTGALPYPSCQCPSGQSDVNGVCTNDTPAPASCPIGYTSSNGTCILAITDPKKDNPSAYQTIAFNRNAFMKQIGVDYAFSKGYSGYVVSRDPTLTQSATITSEKVKVGVLDCGIDQDHPALVKNIGAAYNFDYGPCRGSDKTNCYGWEKKGKDSVTGQDMGYFVFYRSKDDYDILLSGQLYTKDKIFSYFADYPDDYDWDTRKNDGNPHTLLLTEDQSSLASMNMVSYDHGTHVAGIIAANTGNANVGMIGVAPNAEIITGVWDPFSSNLNTNKNFLTSSIMQTFVDAGAKVINLSIGPANEKLEKNQAPYLLTHSLSSIFTQDDINAYKIAAKNNIVLVFAAGNASLNSPTLFSSVLLSDELNGKNDPSADLTNLTITVVSANSIDGSTFDIASYSNKCGVSKNFCLAAPGGDGTLFYAAGLNPIDGLVYSSVVNDMNHTAGAYGYSQGTSMAAPIVTGSVAVLMGAYPYLTPQQVVSILFETATDIGEAGVDDVFGHGLINLKAATEPVGTLWLPTSTVTTGSGSSVALSGLSLPLSLSASIQKNLPENIMMLDSYARPFAISTQTLITAEKRQKQSFADTLKAFSSKKRKTVQPSDSFSFAFDETLTSRSDLSAGLMEMNYLFTNGSRLEFSFNEQTTLHTKDFFSKSVRNPFLQMRNAYALGGDFKLSDRFSFLTNISFGESAFIKDSELSSSLEGRSTLTDAGIAYHATDDLMLSLSAGVLDETDSLLGLSGKGAFETEGGKTQFIAAACQWQATPDLSFGARYTQGFTKADKTNALLSFSELKSDSMAFDVKYKLTKEKTLGVSFFSPLKITRGSAVFRLPVARSDSDDTVYYNTAKTPLNKGGREWDIDLFYTEQWGPVLFQAQTGARLNPEHNAQNSTDYRTMFSASFEF